MQIEKILLKHHFTSRNVIKHPGRRNLHLLIFYEIRVLRITNGIHNRIVILFHMSRRGNGRARDQHN